MTGSRIVIAVNSLLLTFSILSTNTRAQVELVENGSFNGVDTGRSGFRRGMGGLFGHNDS